MAIDVHVAPPGAKTDVKFNSPWSLVLDAGDEASYVVGPNVGGGFFLPQEVNLTSAGGVQFNLQGGTGAITGTATVPKGATLGIQVDDNPEQTVKSGPFSLSP